ncbi:hypothetical protein [Naasia aerilata]|nr:hypothetical protein [Naasia aerilata]
MKSCRIDPTIGKKTTKKPTTPMIPATSDRMLRIGDFWAGAPPVYGDCGAAAYGLCAGWAA